MTPAEPAGVELSGPATPGGARRPGRPWSADRRVIEVAVVVVMVLWAGNFIVVKGAIEVIPPIAFTFLRFGLASLTLLVLLRWREGALHLPRADLVRLAVLGSVGFGCYQILWTVALQTIPAGDSALLIATTPVITALLAVALREDVLSPVKLAGAVVSFVGVALVIAAGQGLDLGVSLVGDLLTLAAALCWSLYTVFGAVILRRHSPLRATTWAIVSGTLFMAPIGLAQLVTIDPGRVGLDVVVAILYAGSLAAGLSNVVVFQGLKMLGPTRVTAFQFLVPPLAVVLAAIFLGEAIRPVQIAGGAIILAGVALLRRGAWSTRKPMQPAAT
jgi:drug/metabolite transporter (DMT)-like permease